MINKEHAEEIALRKVREAKPWLKARMARSMFLDPAEFVAQYRYKLSADGVVDVAAIGPARWVVVLEIEWSTRPLLDVPRSLVVEVNAETAEASFSQRL